MRIIPAIDIIDGKCIRLTKGDFNKVTSYSEKPLEIALRFEAMGLKYLHLVDLDGAKSGNVKNIRILEDISSRTNLKIDFSGGINKSSTANEVLNAGATQITIGSLAVKKPQVFSELLAELGPESIVLGADSRKGKIAISGWLEDSDLDTIEFIRSKADQGVKNIMCTSIDRDGALQGPDIILYSKILNETKVNLIASGGVSSVQDLRDLKKIGCESAIVGKALYEGNISLNQLAGFC